ncbi:hypothetical protein AX15_005862 [Amanita polypyramis BW_CC]|nr:hypothetical protein AX15_005862 [Amanita polypyramis BW_CC]
MSFALSWLASSSVSISRTASSSRIIFDTWDEGGIFDWYRELRYTTIHKLELRKERESVKHEFVLIYADEGMVYRIDRRALGGINPEAIALSGHCEAEDTVAMVSPSDVLNIHSNTDSEIVMEFHANEPDLYLLIATCVATLMDPKSRYYTLQYYNCYFLSRTIAAAALRHYMLQHPSTSPMPSDGVRWDLAIAPVLSREEVARKDWSTLNATVGRAIATAVEQVIWPIIEEYAKSQIKEPSQLHKILSMVINEAVTKNMGDLVGMELLAALYEETLASAEFTLWCESLGRLLSAPRYRDQCDAVVGKILWALTAAHQEQRGLLEEMAGRIEDLVTQSYFVVRESEHTTSTGRGFMKPLQRAMDKALPSSVSIAAQKLARDQCDALVHVTRRVSEKIPRPIVDKLPREVTRHLSLDHPGRIKILRESIYEALTSWPLKDKIARNVLNAILHKSEGELPQSVRVYIRKSTGYEQLWTHATLQNHILDMTRKHSKKVALSKLKLDEESTYNDLCYKTEEIWRVLRPHSIPPSHLKKTLGRITGVVKERVHTMHAVGHDYMARMSS